MARQRLTDEDVAIMKAMLNRNVSQFDIASVFGCAATIVSDVHRCVRFRSVEPADLSEPAVMMRIIERMAAWNGRVHKLILSMFAGAAPPKGRVV